MKLIIDDDGIPYTVLDHIERYDFLTTGDNWEHVYQVGEAIDATIAYIYKDQLRIMDRRFRMGDRVAAYNHKGQREGKGTVIRSTDQRLLNYIHVRLDSGFEAYYRADYCKRLVKKNG